MAGNDIRVGFISSYSAETGMASIYYPDRQAEVTADLPVLAPFGVLQTLSKGDAVLVAHLSNGGEAGIVLGSYSVEGDIPEAGISVSDGKLILRDTSGSISLEKIIAKCNEKE